MRNSWGRKIVRLNSLLRCELIPCFRRDRRPGTLDVHPTLNALVLNYELEVQILGDNENILFGEKTVSTIDDRFILSY